MPRRFSGDTAFDQYIEQLQRVQADLPIAFATGLARTGEELARTVKEDIIGSTTFPGWQPLTESTVAQKANKGWGKGGDPNTMLYARGELAASVQHSSDQNSATYGTNEKTAVWMEYGTIKMVARPFIAPAIDIAWPKLKIRWCKLIKRTLEGEPPKW